MPLDSIIVRGTREHNLSHCHSKRPEGAKNLGCPHAPQLIGETLRGVYPEHSRRAQGDTRGHLSRLLRCQHAP